MGKGGELFVLINDSEGAGVGAVLKLRRFHLHECFKICANTLRSPVTRSDSHLSGV